MYPSLRYVDVDAYLLSRLSLMLSTFESSFDYVQYVQELLVRTVTEILLSSHSVNLNIKVSFSGGNVFFFATDCRCGCLLA